MSRGTLVLVAALVAWGTTMTVLYLRSRGAVPAVVSPVLAQNESSEALREQEKILFARQFTEKLFNYDHDSFWAQQTSLAYMMTPALRDGYLREISDRREKLARKKFRQTFKIVDVSVGPEHVLVTGLLEGRDTDNNWKKEITHHLVLRETDRTLENPWGYLVDLSATSLKPDFGFPPALVLKIGAVANLSFPCLVRNIELPKDSGLQVRIVSLSTSEVQFRATSERREPLPFKAFCNEGTMESSLTALKAPANYATAYHVFDSGNFKKAVVHNGRPAAYQTNLEKELGFVIEDASEKPASR